MKTIDFNNNPSMEQPIKMINQMLRCIAAICLMLATFVSLLQAQDLPFTSASTGVDGPLKFSGVPENGGRYQHVMAYDAARQRTILFGGNCSFGSACYLSDTWAFDGTNWTQLSPASVPQGRFFSAMTYDAARQRVVMFGGQRSGSVGNDTWTWDGTNWTQMNPITSPSARYGHSMAYDSARQKVVLFGGSADFQNDETWTWDGTNWTQIALITSPSRRYYHSMAFDLVRQRVVLFGGYDRNFGYQADTWLWDGAGWSQPSPATTPRGRQNHTMAFDLVRQQLVMFGGYGNLGSYGSDTWIWDGTNWSQPTPVSSPSARRDSALAYDVANQNMILFAGFGPPSGARNDTWTWNGTNWTFVSDSTQTFDMRTKTNGVWNYTSIDVPSGVTVNFIKNAANSPVTWLATSNVVVNGTLNLVGANVGANGGINPLPGNEAAGGPGGFAGGLGGIRFDQSGSYAGTPGQGPGGGLPGVTVQQGGRNATHISTYGNPYIQPLIGGSGGGGGGASATGNGVNGGGGGGAIYISSSRDIVINGSITAKGGDAFSAGAGSGGAIRLQADRVSGAGSLNADRGGYGNQPPPDQGRIRIEAYYRTLAGSTTPTSVNTAPVVQQNISSAGALIISSVAGQGVVQPPGGNTQSPDVIFTQAGPISVVATSTNIPNATPVILRVTSNGQIINTTNTLTAGSVSFNVTVPAGVGTIQASANFTVSN